MHPCGQFRSNHLGTDYATETELAARSRACLPVGPPLSIKDLTRGTGRESVQPPVSVQPYTPV